MVMVNRRLLFAWLSTPMGLRARFIWWVGPAATAGVCKTPTRKHREFESRTHHTCGHGGTGIRAALRMLSFGIRVRLPVSAPDRVRGLWPRDIAAHAWRHDGRGAMDALQIGSCGVLRIHVGREALGVRLPLHPLV